MKIKRLLLAVLAMCCVSLSSVSDARAGACTDPSEESGYSTCVINDGFLYCQASHPSCDYYEYYINPHDPVSVMIDQCCGFPTVESQRSCFKKKRKQVTKGPFPSRFKLEVKDIVNNYISDPEVFCTEH